MKVETLDAALANFRTVVNKIVDGPFAAIELDSFREKRLLIEALKLADGYSLICEEMIEALRKIESIQNSYHGGDWDEINEARLIARDAFYYATGIELTTNHELNADKEQTP